MTYTNQNYNSVFPTKDVGNNNSDEKSWEGAKPVFVAGPTKPQICHVHWGTHSISLFIHVDSRLVILKREILGSYYTREVKRAKATAKYRPQMDLYEGFISPRAYAILKCYRLVLHLSTFHIGTRTRHACLCSSWVRLHAPSPGAAIRGFAAGGLD